MFSNLAELNIDVSKLKIVQVFIVNDHMMGYGSFLNQ